MRRKPRDGFEPETSVTALGWIGKRVRALPNAGWGDPSEPSNTGRCAEADDRPQIPEYGWFRFQPDEQSKTILAHTAEFELLDA